MQMDKPNILILGGCGFIGRNLVKYLLANDLAGAIRVVDKAPPQVAWMNAETQQYFNSPIVEFKSANLINLESCKQSFARNDSTWHLAVNCAAETKTGQSAAVYDEGIVRLSLNCARAAALHQVPHYVELSSGRMRSADKVPHRECDPLEPWSFLGKCKQRVERELEQIAGLNYTVLRLADVYGVGDRSCLTPRIIAAAIYRHLGEPMKLLWNAEMKINTVHVEDVCSAIWMVANRSDTLGQIYNVVDDANSTQGSIFALLSDYFGIKVDFLGNTLSSVVDLVTVSDEANDKHLIPWAEVCRSDGIENTPLTPHMDPEALQHRHLHLSGEKLKKLGFNAKFPAPTIEQIAAIVRDYLDMNVFPRSLAPA